MNIMKKNVGKMDRFIRIAAASFLILLVLSNQILGLTSYVGVALAIVLFATALFGTCPLYTILNISSKKR